jgi:amidohydrolase
MNKINKIVNDELFEWIRDIRRKVHQFPELAFKEEKTAELIEKKLKKLGIKYQSGIAETGVVGKLMVDENAPTVAIRADMDALPVTENTGLPYSSKNPGIMHACGHDGHIAIVLGVAALLKKNPPEGNVVFIFQPAEEELGGAKPMIEQGVLDDVDVIFGGHIERHYQVGEIGIKAGIHTSHVDAFVIKIIGKGGHAARPHLAIDAVLIASQLVVNLQSIISRQIDPIHPSVITVGYLKSGTIDNVIAEKATLKGTIRTTNEFIRAEIIEKIKKLASSMAILYGAEINVEMKPGYPPIVNEERVTKFAVQVAEKLLGKDNTIAIPYPSLGGEDFSYYLQQIPGCFVRYGAAKEGHETASSHSPNFDFDEETLKIGTAYMSELIRFTIKKLRNK